MPVNQMETNLQAITTTIAFLEGGFLQSRASIQIKRRKGSAFTRIECSSHIVFGIGKS